MSIKMYSDLNKCLENQPKLYESHFSSFFHLIFPEISLHIFEKILTIPLKYVLQESLNIEDLHLVW